LNLTLLRRRRLNLALLGWRLNLTLLRRRRLNLALLGWRWLNLPLLQRRRLARLRRRLPFVLFALRWRLRHDDGPVERRGVDGPQHHSRQDRPRQEALFRVRHQIRISVSGA
jgi:hypothetical protein